MFSTLSRRIGHSGDVPLLKSYAKLWASCDAFSANYLKMLMGFTVKRRCAWQSINNDSWWETPIIEILCYRPLYIFDSFEQTFNLLKMQLANIIKTRPLYDYWDVTPYVMDMPIKHSGEGSSRKLSHLPMAFYYSSEGLIALAHVEADLLNISRANQARDERVANSMFRLDSSRDLGGAISRDSSPFAMGKAQVIESSRALDDDGINSTSWHVLLSVFDKALRVWDLQAIPLVENDVIQPETGDAFICFLQGHWFCIRMLNGEWYKFYGLYAAPMHLSNFDLLQDINSLKGSACSIFLVMGDFTKGSPEVVSRLMESFSTPFVPEKGGGKKKKLRAMKKPLEASPDCEFELPVPIPFLLW